ncbi:protein of unknown function [Methylocaldum szegediense]|uniref:Uncharacterized protein n=1 Tax=Methylocaldum szegediense TaxID=73780 RepID=A0ABN8X119_9GAMM|nr:protein of unknown function [Methylocaldum szegediense]
MDALVESLVRAVHSVVEEIKVAGSV